MTAPRIRTHPGEVLREEFMQPLGLSAAQAALGARVERDVRVRAA